MAKLSVTDLIEEALIYAVQDRESYASAVGWTTPEGLGARDLARQMRAYHKKRYGREHLNHVEEALSKSTTISVHDLQMRDGPNRDFGRGDDQ